MLELDRQLNLNEAVLRTKVTRPEHTLSGPSATDPFSHQQRYY